MPEADFVVAPKDAQETSKVISITNYYKLANVCPCVTLKSDKSHRAIRVEYPDMPYVGFWHMPKTDAPYIYIEPWSSLSSRKGIVEDLATQPGLVSLNSGCEYTNQWSVELVF